MNAGDFDRYVKGRRNNVEEDEHGRLHITEGIDPSPRPHRARTSSVLFECDQLTVTEGGKDGVQIAVGKPDWFYAQDLSAAETMRLAAILWLRAQGESE